MARCSPYISALPTKPVIHKKERICYSLKKEKKKEKQELRKMQGLAEMGMLSAPVGNFQGPFSNINNCLEHGFPFIS